MSSASVVGNLAGLVGSGVAVASALKGFADPPEGADPFGLVMGGASLAAMTLREVALIPSPLSEQARKLLGKVEEAQRIGTMAYCAFEVTTNPESALRVLSTLMENLGAAVAEMVSAVLEAVSIQIEEALGNIIHTVGSLINSVLSLVNAVGSLVNALLSLRENWTIQGNKWHDERISNEYCEAMMSTLLACLLNKLVGDPIEKLKNRLVDRIDEWGGSINSAIQDELEDTQILSNYIGHEACLIGTAAAQIQGLSNSMGA